MVSNRIRTVADSARIAVFLAVIGLPLAGTFVDNRFNKNNDMRPLAAFPAVGFKSSVLKAFPGNFESYWSDHFGFRGALIQALRVVRLRWLHTPTFAQVLVGQTSWLYYVMLQPGLDYSTSRPFTEAELEGWRRVLEHRRDWLERRGCRYLLFIPPDKQTIYPEDLDPLYRPSQGASRLDQLLDYLRSHRVRVEILDIRQPLLQAKQRERLYHRTDSHWNDRGAFIGYQQLAGVLAKWFPSIHPTPRDAFAEVEQSGTGGDLAQMLSLQEWNHEQWLKLEPRKPRKARMIWDGIAPPAHVADSMAPPFAVECDDARLPRAVVFHDSFFLALAPMLAEHFRRAVCIWHDDFHPDVVEREHPDVVVHELVERKLMCINPTDFEEGRDR